MKEIKINSLVEFLQKLEENAIEIYGDKDQRVYFRGESEDYGVNKLKPKAFRILKHEKNVQSEHKSYRRALRERPNEFSSNMSSLDILSKMQHFGLGTRLLDYTTNPLVALYFSCDNDIKDGYVYILKGNISNNKFNEEKSVVSSNDPRVILLTNLPKHNDYQLDLYGKIMMFALEEFPDERITLVPKLDIVNDHYEEQYYDGNPMDLRSLYSTQEINDFQNIQMSLTSNSIKEYPLFNKLELFPHELFQSYFVKPSYTNENIEKQSGLFYLSGLNSESAKPDYVFKIAKENKEKILAELKLFAGIDKSSLFSGLEGVTNNNKDYLVKLYLDKLK